MMEDFMEDYVKNGDAAGGPGDEGVVEEVISVETVDDVEATPFLPDGTESIVLEPDILELDPVFTPVAKQQQQQQHQQQQDTRLLHTLQMDMNDNKALIQELKTSINLLKASTSRIERDSRDLSTSIARSNVENTRLNNSLIDLEFRFNEVVTRQEEVEADTRNNNNDKNDVNVADIEENVLEECRTLIEKQMQVTIETIEEKMDKLKMRVDTIDKKLEEQRKREESKPVIEKPVLSPTPVSAPNPPINADLKAMLMKVETCIARTNQNDKSIATAWVGLIASLFLIPIAFFLGKFWTL